MILKFHAWGNIVSVMRGGRPYPDNAEPKPVKILSYHLVGRLSKGTSLVFHCITPNGVLVFVPSNCVEVFEIDHPLGVHYSNLFEEMAEKVAELRGVEISDDDDGAPGAPDAWPPSD
jgi:hypothetical protein